MHRLCCIVAAWTWIGVISVQPPAGSVSEAAGVQELTKLETVWNDAHLRGDAAALDRLWAEDLTVAVPAMPVLTKKDSLAIWRSGRVRFDRYETSDVAVRLYGDSAVVTGRLQRSRTINGRAMDDDWRFTKTYVRRAGAWQVVAFHASPAAQDGATTDGLLARVDHLVYATPDLQLGIDTLEKALGIRAAAGGQHPGRGTRNALIALGPASYIEIIGPDPDQPKPDGPRPFGIDGLNAPRLMAWAAKGQDLDQLAADARRRGVALGDVTPGSRRRPDGVVLAWRYTDPRTVVADGLVPFFIDWGATPHPATAAAGGATLVALRAEHPDPARVQTMLDALRLDLRVLRGDRPALIAAVSCPRGRVEVR